MSTPVLEEIEEIKKLKYRYIRFLDCKQWAEMRDVFTEDAESAYDGGHFAAKGRDEIIGFLESALGRADIVHLHQVHCPEIELTSATTAKGRWYLEDRVINPGEASAGMRARGILEGTAYYEDEYVKQDGQWKIRFTGYERVYEEQRDLPEDPSRVIRSRFESSVA